MTNEIKSLASYVTYRQLYNDGKCDIYYVVSKFAESIIISQKLYLFGITEISEQINSQFGFSIPEYVIQSSLKRLEYVSRSNNLYTVSAAMVMNEMDVVSSTVESISVINENIANNLIKYVEDKKGTLSVEQRIKLQREFCSFLLDDTIHNGFSELISAFILDNESDEIFQSHLAQIKEGAVLFAGLNYNSNISDSSAWKDEIIIYVENEILFHLAGYNGIVFQKLAEELFSLISEMNLKSKKKVIKVRYFKEVSDEIDSFFARAVDIVEGKTLVTVDNYAMAEIVKGCHSAADVIDKKAHFNSLLQNKLITKENETNYYTDELHKYNLESPEAIKKYQLTDDKLRYIKHLNYVNILRKNNHSKDLKRSKYIVLTETGKMLKMAAEFCEDSICTPLAVNMYALTNRLWFDLNKGFGANEFPTSFSVLVKSRIVLSKILTQNVTVKFEQAKDKYRRKEIDENQLADSILLLREEVKKPEDISKGAVEDILSFISEEQLVIHQSEKELLANKLQDSEKERNALADVIRHQEEEVSVIQKRAKEQSEYMQRKNDELIAKQKDDLQNQLAEIEKRKERADIKISNSLKRFKICIISLAILYYLGILIVFIKGNEDVKLIIPILLAIVPPVISAVISILSEKKFDFFELYKKLVGIVEKRYMRKVYAEYMIKPERILELKNRLVDIE